MVLSQENIIEIQLTDTMRARLNKVENRDRYKKRIEMSENIINFIKREFLVPEDEIPIFVLF